jgi:hypothetical protein
MGQELDRGQFSGEQKLISGQKWGMSGFSSHLSFFYLPHSIEGEVCLISYNLLK